jgi:two-component system, LytTR family, sensor kinase
MPSTNKTKIFIYSSVFIALILNLPKLFALKKDGFLAHYWHFDLTELILQALLNLIFCLCLFFYSANNFKNLFAKGEKGKSKYIVINLLLFIGFALVGLTLEKVLFKPGILPGGGVMLRFISSMVLVALELRIIYLLEETKSKELENEHLRNENLKAGMELLKAQLNPHFFFNALSSLSAIVRENPPQAQVYISHLSRIFRYSLYNTEDNIVSLKEELDAVSSYAELMKMRYETGFEIKIDIEEKNYSFQLPHMSLQPLIENAVKHNAISVTKPLLVTISFDDENVSVANNLNPVKFAGSSDGIGLANLSDRYKLLMKKEIKIIKTENSFVVKLPIK